jgi:hypothetical protein
MSEEREDSIWRSSRFEVCSYGHDKQCTGKVACDRGCSKTRFMKLVSKQPDNAVHVSSISAVDRFGDDDLRKRREHKIPARVKSQTTTDKLRIGMNLGIRLHDDGARCATANIEWPVIGRRIDAVHSVGTSMGK